MHEFGIAEAILTAVENRADGSGYSERECGRAPCSASRNPR
ncbi:hypothetical protein ACFQX6_58020 [Streptosporangium lutulentum]